MMDMNSLLSGNRLLPVVIIDHVEDTVPLCEAILEGGLGTVEFTLRTPTALACIAEATKRFPDLSVGAGTVTTPEQAVRAKESGAVFGVSPGTTAALRDAVVEMEFPFLPGGSTPSEFMANSEAGFDIQKFFPAEVSGGCGFLSSLTSPFPQLSFCPTGGINQENANTYLSLPNVIAIGGSWFVGPERIQNKEWSVISRDIREIIKKLS